MAALAIPGLGFGKNQSNKPTGTTFLSTWSHGQVANEKAQQVFEESGEILQSVEEGVKIVESDADGRSVGLGGLPDSSGRVTLDACIMKGNGACGSVGALHNIEHPISVAREVMEKHPSRHVGGSGSKRFCFEKRFS